MERSNPYRIFLRMRFNMSMKLRIGTRGSELARVQTQLVVDALTSMHPKIELEVIPIRTLGDNKQGTSQAACGDKRDWIHELELAVLDSTIDCAVHSGKDIPAEISSKTRLVSLLQREDPRDVFVGALGRSKTRTQFENLPKGAVVGTSSVRRVASLLRLRPDLKLIGHRGNVPTRLAKLDQSEELAGIVLAASGLIRLGRTELRVESFDPQIVMPAVNQGILVAQYRRDDSKTEEILRDCTDFATEAGFIAERGCIEKLQADCHSAVGVFATVDSTALTLTARVMSSDGSRAVEGLISGDCKEALELGKRLGQDLLNRGAAELIAESTKLSSKYKL